MRTMRLAALLLCAGMGATVAGLPGSAIAQPTATPEAAQAAYEQKMSTLLASLRRQTGDVAVPEAKATLHLGDKYYFLDAADSRKVLVDAWNNPPGAADGVLGMVFPAGSTFMDADGWGAVLTYEPSGYVTDDDAASADYTELLNSMREGEESANEERSKQGYPRMHLAGWAQRPTYDRASHSVIWARDLQVDGAPQHTLNYDVRLLGRNGVLSLNMISGMSQLDGVRRAAGAFGQAVSFDSGSRYADYVPDVDKKAGYGIAGLVAAGAGMAVAKKAGLLALALGFGKKLLVLVAVGAAALWRGIKRMFGRGEAEG
jgi:uncharacterized membrane-anchored protein